MSLRSGRCAAAPKDSFPGALPGAAGTRFAASATGTSVILVGFMGTGKSTVGRLLAARLGRPFVDTDAEIARRAGMSVDEVFRRQGEAAFRRLEAEVVGEVASGSGLVVATGGGVLLRPENRRRLEESGFLVLLRATPEVLAARLEAAGLAGRPLLAGGPLPRRVAELLEERRGVYQSVDVQVDTTGRSPEEVADLVVRLLPALEARRAALPAVSVSETAVGVELGERSYPILVGDGLLARAGRLVRERLAETGYETDRALLVTHPEIGALYGHEVLNGFEEAGFRVGVAEVPPGEESKSLQQAARLYDACVAASLDRRSPVVALGGGVIGDLAGFVAATYLRGVPFVQLPTTLLAQVDASVGGKVAVNHPLAKNLIGAFHQPLLVAADVSTLRTLPARELAAGLAEAVKHGLLADPAYFAYLEENAPLLLGRSLPHLASLVAGSCRIKAAVVAADEREAGLRQVLNLGHTVGHALEAATGYGSFLHGEAVAVGMVAAGRIALALGTGWTARDQERLEALLVSLSLPVRLPSLPLEALLAAASLDKKAAAGDITWILPEAVGRVRRQRGVEPAVVARTLVELGARP